MIFIIAIVLLFSFYKEGDAKVEIKVVREAYVTAYSSVESCWDERCTMASGKSAYVGAVACPRDLRLGSKVKIDDVTYVCEDRTARRYNGRFDLFMGYGPKAHGKAINWGIVKLKVEIIQ